SANQVRAGPQSQDRKGAWPKSAAHDPSGRRRGDRMIPKLKRRDFITLLGGAAAAWPLPARGQQAGQMRRIGLIAHERLKHYDVLFDELRQLGYVEGHNIIVERRYAQGSAERFDEFAAEMVRLKADLIIVNTTPAAIAVKKVTTTTPIVIPTAIDPVGAGLISSFAHPGGNITGSTILSAELNTLQLAQIYLQTGGGPYIRKGQVVPSSLSSWFSADIKGLE